MIFPITKSTGRSCVNRQPAKTCKGHVLPNQVGAWKKFRSQAPLVGATFFTQPSFTSLPKKVQGALRALLAMRPDRQEDVSKLLADPQFQGLPNEAKEAVFETGKPNELDHIQQVLAHETWQELDAPKHDLLYLDEKVQIGILDLSQYYYSPDADHYLMKLIRADWFWQMDPADQLRGAKLIAHLASMIDGATFEKEGVSQRAIMETTLEALTGSMSLRFEDLPMEDQVGMTGYPDYPSTVVLNRNAVTADAKPVAAHGERSIEAWMALASLPHEVRHLLHPVEAEPTYEAFMDEYQAWFHGFVAAFERFPTKEEALDWIEKLVTEPRYAYIQEAVTTPGEGERIETFLGNFSREAADLVKDAPLPHRDSLVVGVPGGCW